MRGENDRRLFDCRDLIDRPHAEVFHLFDDALVVDDLAEDRAATACSSEALHFQISDANAGTEAVFGGSFDSHSLPDNAVRLAYNPAP